MMSRFSNFKRQLRDIGWDVLVNGIAASKLIPRALRRVLLRRAGIVLGRSTIAPGVFMGSRTIRVGSRSFINRQVFIDGSAAVDIGDNVDIGMRVMIITGSHVIQGSSRRAGSADARGVIIESGSWIGAGAMILPGVTVEAGCVIAAGAVVTQRCSTGGLYAGVPARRVRELDDEEEIRS